jgi:hypothetical protein
MKVVLNSEASIVVDFDDVPADAIAVIDEKFEQVSML